MATTTTDIPHGPTAHQPTHGEQAGDVRYNSCRDPDPDTLNPHTVSILNKGIDSILNQGIDNVQLSIPLKVVQAKKMAAKTTYTQCGPTTHQPTHGERAGDVWYNSCRDLDPDTLNPKQ